MKSGSVEIYQGRYPGGFARTETDRGLGTPCARRARTYRDRLRAPLVNQPERFVLSIRVFRTDFGFEINRPDGAIFPGRGSVGQQLPSAAVARPWQRTLRTAQPNCVPSDGRQLEFPANDNYSDST